MKSVVSVVVLTGAVLMLSGCIERLYDLTHFTKRTVVSEALKAQALAGDVEAQYNIGQHYCCGETNLQTDNVQALKWFCLAAKNGQRDAMYEVGNIYETAHEYEGSIIPRSDIRAFVYYSKAVENGNDKAVEAKERTHKRLSKGDLKTTKYLQEQWPVIGCEIGR